MIGYGTAGNEIRYDYEYDGPAEQGVSNVTEYFLHVKQIPAVTVKTGSGEPPLDETQMSSIWSANSEILQMIGNLYTNGL